MKIWPKYVDFPSLMLGFLLPVTDPLEQKDVDGGGDKKSKHIEKWVENTFHAWRLERGFPINKSIGDLCDESNLCPFASMLSQFVVEVRKKDESI